jgi:hypothetical protein
MESLLPPGRADGQTFAASARSVRRNASRVALVKGEVAAVINVGNAVATSEDEAHPVPGIA